jgi:hypothetical protein
MIATNDSLEICSIVRPERESSIEMVDVEDQAPMSPYHHQTFLVANRTKYRVSLLLLLFLFPSSVHLQMKIMEQKHCTHGPY